MNIMKTCCFGSQMHHGLLENAMREILIRRRDYAPNTMLHTCETYCQGRLRLLLVLSLCPGTCPGQRDNGER